MTQAPKSTAARFPGLTAEEAAELARASGTNRFEPDTTRSYVRIFIDNAFPAANVALVVVAAVLIALGLYIDAFFTAGLVAGNIVVGVFQEARAKRQLERITVLARAPARVVRDGLEQSLDPDDLVEGDVVVIGPGEQVQADGTVLEASLCSVDESLLTGEADLVRKSAGDTVFSGSFCMGGQAVYRCERIGSSSVANDIAARARSFGVVRTPLQREVGYVMWGMAGVVALISIAVFKSFHDIYGHAPLVETTRAAAVIVALVPQGLWVMVTVTYALAIVRLSPLGVLVQRLNAVESISHVDVLCLDKTGTITTNALALETLHPLALDGPELRRLLGVYAASATISNRTNETIRTALGGDARTPAAEVYFDSVRKWSALLFDAEDMQGVYVLGAPEVLLDHVAADERDRLRAWSEQGLRVLVFTHAPEAVAIAYGGDVPQLPERLVPLGFVVLRDELRDGARETIAGFAQAGIALKIISGDNPATVAALARAAGVTGSGAAVSGLDLDTTDPDALAEVAEQATVFGRISPAQKASIVAALQRRGYYVAMIGDGVNDVPALKRSHVAISVRSASPVTRSIADLLLLDDSFSSLPGAFTEGRRVRSGMEAIIRLFLVRTFGAAVLILGVALLSSEFPLTPRLTAILSTLTVGIPALFIAAWAKPRLTARYLIGSSALFVVPAALLLGAMSIVVYEIALGHYDVPTARTVITAAGVFAGVTLIPYAGDQPSLWLRLRGLVASPRVSALAAVMLLLFVVAFAFDPLRRFYELTPLSIWLWLLAIAGAASWALALAASWRIAASRGCPRQSY